jgi:hypothetical protein
VYGSRFKGTITNIARKNYQQATFLCKRSLNENIGSRRRKGVPDGYAEEPRVHTRFEYEYELTAVGTYGARITEVLTPPGRGRQRKKIGWRMQSRCEHPEKIQAKAWRSALPQEATGDMNRSA